MLGFEASARHGGQECWCYFPLPLDIHSRSSGGEHTWHVQALAALPDGHPIGVGKDRTLGLLDLDTGQHPVLREKYTGLVSGGGDGTIRILGLFR